MISADIRGSVYSTVRNSGGKEEYEELLRLFKNTDLHEERDRIQRVLGCGSVSVSLFFLLLVSFCFLVLSVVGQFLFCLFESARANYSN